MDDCSLGMGRVANRKMMIHTHTQLDEIPRFVPGDSHADRHGPALEDQV
jgi:hypothetical protein